MGDREDLRDDDESYTVGAAFFWDVDFNIDPKFDRSLRKPIVVMCPTNWSSEGTPFWIDSLSTEKHEPWGVSVDLNSLVIGQKPIITLTPSIHLIGIWHGWLQQGVLHN